MVEGAEDKGKNSRKKRPPRSPGYHGKAADIPAARIPPSRKEAPPKAESGRLLSKDRQRGESRIFPEAPMTFPRFCLYSLLAACLLLPGCVANQYALKVNAITDGVPRAGTGDVYFIMAVKGQENDLVFHELKRNLEATLPETGLRVTGSLPHATAVLFAGYKSGAVSRRTTVSEPVYGTTRIETRSGGEYYNTMTGRYSKTTVSTPSYGITGYKNTQKKVTENRLVLLLSATSLKTEKKIWETFVIYNGSSFDDRKMLKTMVQAAKGYFAQDTPGDTWLDVSESDDGTLSIEERKQQ